MLDLLPNISLVEARVFYDEVGSSVLFCRQVNTEAAVSNLNDNMLEIPKSMRAFSLCMRALYAESEVSSKEEGGRKFNQLRDDTKRDALVYINGVLPVSTTLVRSISEFFEYYQDLSMDEWEENLSEIIEEVKGYRQCCAEVVRLHEDIMASLKERQDQATILIIELCELKAEYEKRKRQLKLNATSKIIAGLGLCLFPVVAIFATPLLLFGAERDAAGAVANGFQATVSQQVALLVSDEMVPALESFISGIEGIAGFFAVIEQELTTFQSKGEKAKQKAIKLHYTMMKSKAASINKGCKGFFAMIPGVRSDFLAIPDTPSDQNYVDKWLAKKEEEIRQKYRNRLTAQLSGMMKYFSRNAAVQMITQYGNESGNTEGKIIERFKEL